MRLEQEIRSEQGVKYRPWPYRTAWSFSDCSFRAMMAAHNSAYRLLMKCGWRSTWPSFCVSHVCTLWMCWKNTNSKRGCSSPRTASKYLQHLTVKLHTEHQKAVILIMIKLPWLGNNLR